MEKTCEVCGTPATVQAAQLEEVPPVRGANGDWWQKWKCLSKHAFCLDHDRPMPAIEHPEFWP